MRFTKMQGLGNDFIVIDATLSRISLDAETVRVLCDRHYGVGADQVLVVAPAQDASHDFVYRIYNADGSEAEQCGNGARCLALFLRGKGLSDKRRVRLKTVARVIEVEALDDVTASVDMGRADFGAQAAGLDERSDALAGRDAATGLFAAALSCGGVRFCPVSMGNPCAVVPVKDLEALDVEGLGSELSARLFEKGANVVFARKVSEGALEVRVFERGAGETLACGTGSTAAAAFAFEHLSMQGEIEVATRGGTLRVRRRADGHLFLTGPAVFVFEGQIGEGH